MEYPFEFTPLMLAGLALCLTAVLLAAALLVIAIVPAAQTSVLKGLEMLLNFLVQALDVMTLINRRSTDRQEENKNPPP